MLIAAKAEESGRIVISKPVREALEIGTDDLIEIRVGGYTTTVPIRSTHRVTIPSQLRDEVGIDTGDIVEIDVKRPTT